MAISALGQMAQATATLELYVDADYSINGAAAASIELGVRTALSEEDFKLGGLDVTVVPKDHRGNVRRSRNTYDSFLDSQTAIAIIGGLHSPPYLAYKSFLNSHGILTLLPWAAAGPITRPDDGSENWIFRLSVDDRKSGPFLVQQAEEVSGCKAIALLLLETGWGRTNEETLTAALRERHREPALVAYFPTTVGKAVAGSLAESVKASGVDCAIILANGGNGAEMVEALGARVPNLRLFSHWGITGNGDFTDRIGPDLRQGMQIKVLQSCGLQRESEGNPVLKAALAEAVPAAASLAAIPAAAGFVQGYDLTRILLNAAKQAAGTPDWQGDIVARRRALKTALESLDAPVEGILKRYIAPFAPYSKHTPDAHEALGLDDLCMARFAEDGTLEDAD